MTTIQHKSIHYSAERSSMPGIIQLLASIILFSIHNIIIKMMSDNYALLQISLIRSMFAVPMVLSLLVSNGGFRALRTKTTGLQILRGLAMFSTNLFFLMALSALPFGTNQALVFSAPLFMTALSALLLKETVGWQRWAAVFVGFIGVLIVVRPDSASFEIATLFALASALLYALGVITTRTMEDNGAVTTVYTTGVCLIGALILSPIFALIETSSVHISIKFLTQTWYAMPPNDVAIMALLACLWVLTIFLLSTAYQTTSVATLAPIEYSSVAFGILIGFVFWQEIPTMQMLAGLSLIVGSGLLIIYHNNQSAS